MLGSGFIARFYAESLHAQRRKDHVVMVYSRKRKKRRTFCRRLRIAPFQHLHGRSHCPSRGRCGPDRIAKPFARGRGTAMCQGKKHVICTKPLGRNAEEAKRMLDAVEEAGIFGGYLEDLCYTPKFLKSMESVKRGDIGKVLWAKSRETHPGPHSDWFWDKEKSGGGAIIDLGCHCVEISRNFIGKNIKPLEVMCWADTQVHPIEAEDHAIGLVKYANGAIGQFEVSWTFRGGMDLRDEVMGTEGTIWVNSFLRTGFEMFTTGKGGRGLCGRKGGIEFGLVVPRWGRGA